MKQGIIVFLACLACLVGGCFFLSIFQDALAVDPAQIITGTDELLYDSYVNNALTTVNRIDALFDTTLAFTALNEIQTVKDFLHSDYYMTGFRTYIDSTGAEFALYREQISCKYNVGVSSDTVAINLINNNEYNWDFTAIDSFRVKNLNDSINTIYLTIFARFKPAVVHADSIDGISD